MKKKKIYNKLALKLFVLLFLFYKKQIPCINEKGAKTARLTALL